MSERAYKPDSSKRHSTQSMPLWATSNSYRVPGLAGWHCSTGYIEAALLGYPNCGWCGRDLEKCRIRVDDRFCSRACAVNYNAHVLGDRSAALGSGKRLLLWLQRNQPAVYRTLTGASVPDGRFCENPDCKRGENGQPAGLSHLRNGSRFCCTDRRVRAHRVKSGS